jgi:hypothetical protein
MARDESTREDLLREATALAERIELRHRDDPSATSIVAGFRANGALSIFFREDPVYQFNAAGELRRAYQQGLLFKAHHGRLASLRRERTASAVALVRHELSTMEQDQFLAHMSERLQSFTALLASEKLVVLGQAPPESNILGRLRQWFDEHREWRVAARPNA